MTKITTATQIQHSAKYKKITNTTTIHSVTNAYKLDISSDAYMLYEHYLANNPTQVATLMLNDISIMQQFQEYIFEEHPYAEYLIDQQDSLTSKKRW